MGMCIQHSFFRCLKLLTILGSLICTSCFNSSSAAVHLRPQRKLQAGSGAGGSARSDMQALLQFKNSLSDPQNPNLSTWTENSNGNSCNWNGVTCNSAGRVTQISLRGLSLEGHLVLAQLLEYMDMLKELDLSYNGLQGNLTLGTSTSCGSLQTLNVSHNHINSVIPAELLQTCSSIKVLDLSSNNITGTFPPDFFSQCGSLQTLDLSANHISGSLPSGIGSCASLQQFDLSSNSLAGPIVESVFSKCEGVQSIDLSLNALSGEIPVSISTCSQLQYLNLSNNRIGRGLPPSLGDLMSISTLDISNNTISGAIPDELGHICLTLAYLDLSLNNLSGSIPSSFASCASLQHLNLASNNLSGSFPIDVLVRMKNLQALQLPFNHFNGPLPLSLAQLPRSLKVLDLGSNRFSGSIPSVVCGPSSALEQFLFPNNLLTGEIPAAIGNCSQLTRLDLTFNRLQGALPEELGQLSRLESISIWFNQLTGEIPKTIGYLSNLKILILNDNLLSGPIPSEISNCSSLEWLSLANNKLSGSIPPSIGSMAQLTLLELGSNSLSGHIPPEMVNASKFVWLDLHSNVLTGPIPPGLGRHPNGEAANRVTGVVFAFIRNDLLNGCSGMGTLLEFSGIPEDALNPTPLMAACNSSRLYLGDVLNKDPDLSSVQFMDLSYNSLEGTIPDEIGSLTALAMLSLGHNQLVGTIPETFKNLTALGVLDLSYNRLEGSLDPLAYSNFLVSIDVSHNNFSGTIPATGQLLTASAAGFDGNPLLCGEPLPKCGALAINGGSNNCTNNDSCNSHGRMGVMPWANSLVLGILIAVAFMCMLIVWGIMMRAKGKQKDADNMLTNLQLGASCHGNSGWNLGGEKEPLSINVATFERPLRKLTFAQLIEATNGFSQESLIGIGGFGEVYKAELKDGSTVAIKKLLQFSYQGDREFTAEMETLGKIKHRNLVPLLGYCKVGEERLLVYEYMHNGSLDDMLHGENRMKEKLTWELRKQIARGAARGLAFLHHNCIPHIIHRDMKSSNVLLDKSLEARVSDFGMARLISALDTHLSVSTLAGTPGYVPPEYYQSFRCTTKGDIYSFGVILLELLTGKRPTDKEFFEDTNLVGWVKQLVNEKKSLDVLDPAMKGNANDEIEMLQYLRIACDCLHDQSSKRPSMLEVVSMLKELQVHEGTH